MTSSSNQRWQSGSYPLMSQQSLFIKRQMKKQNRNRLRSNSQRKPASYDQLDHPELDQASLERAVDKLDQEEKSSFPELEYFGQMHGTYLFAQGKGGLYIIDQHVSLKSGSSMSIIGRRLGCGHSQPAALSALYL